jgi:hypothetical protein
MKQKRLLGGFGDIQSLSRLSQLEVAQQALTKA